MSLKVLVGGETKPKETRAAVTPALAAKMVANGIEVGLQEYPDRAFSDQDYLDVGVRLAELANEWPVVIATKEWTSKQGDIKQIHPGQTLLGFHHCHKGQPHNLPTLKLALKLGASLFDYELFRPEDPNVQPVTTSHHAGIAGAANGLWALAQRLKLVNADQGTADIFSKPQAWGTIDVLRDTHRQLTQLPEDFTIVVVGKTGECGRGAIEVCKWFGLPEISADELSNNPRNGPWYCALGTEDIVKRIGGGSFDRNEYRSEGKQRYENDFEKFLGHFNLLVFCPYWDERYPKMLPHDLILRRANSMPLVVSDVTCDLDGSNACTLHENKVSSPVSTYFAVEGRARDGIFLQGHVVTAVDCLPAQLGVSCSDYVARQLDRHVLPWLPQLEFATELNDLPEGARTGFITWKGKLVDRFAHLEKLL